MAHYQHAFRTKPLPELYSQVFETGESASLQGSQDDATSQALQNLLKDTCSFVETNRTAIDRQMTAEFDKDDIRSVGLKLAGMMIV